MPSHPEMSGPMLADCLSRIRLTHSIPALHALADEIAAAFPTDIATPTLARVLAAKVERLANADKRTRMGDLA